MKKIILSAALLAASLLAFAQEQKTEQKGELSADIALYQTGTDLAKYGYANDDAIALAEAAKILAQVNMEALDAQKTTAGQGVETPEKDGAVCFCPKHLIADAKQLAGKDKKVLAVIAQAEKAVSAGATRGAVGGSKYANDRVLAYDTDIYYVKFWGNQTAEVVVVGDGDTDLDLYIYDENGNLIDSDIDYTDNCVCSWTPAWTGTFTIKIVNRGSVYNRYSLVTN